MHVVIGAYPRQSIVLNIVREETTINETLKRLKKKKKKSVILVLDSKIQSLRIRKIRSKTLDLLEQSHIYTPEAVV